MLYGTGNRSYIVQCPYQWYNGIYESLGGLIGLWELSSFVKHKGPRAVVEGPVDNWLLVIHTSLEPHHVVESLLTIGSWLSIPVLSYHGLAVLKRKVWNKGLMELSSLLKGFNALRNDKS